MTTLPECSRSQEGTARVFWHSIAKERGIRANLTQNLHFLGRLWCYRKSITVRRCEKRAAWLQVTIAGNDVTYPACVDYNSTWKYDSCLHSTCVSGTCVNIEENEEDNGFWCQCFPGYYGNDCELGQFNPAWLRALLNLWPSSRGWPPISWLLAGCRSLKLPVCCSAVCIMSPLLPPGCLGLFSFCLSSTVNGMLSQTVAVQCGFSRAEAGFHYVWPLHHMTEPHTFTGRSRPISVK